MRLAVVGSRDYPKPELIGEILARWPNDTQLISGGARGVDTLAAEHAAEHFVPEPIIYVAHWRGKDGKGKFNRGAGYERNHLIVKDCDQLLAFWDRKSKGTRHSIDLAIKREIPVAVFDENGELAFVAEK